MSAVADMIPSNPDEVAIDPVISHVASQIDRVSFRKNRHSVLADDRFHSGLIRANVRA
jgi:hypothetical protein